MFYPPMSLIHDISIQSWWLKHDHYNPLIIYGLGFQLANQGHINTTLQLYYNYLMFSSIGLRDIIH